MGLFRKIITVASGTLASRILGFIREMLMAAALGTGPVADAFNAAFRFPNSFRRLFAEGALSSAFVPLFSYHIEEKGLNSAKNFASNVFGVMLSCLISISLIAQLSMPAIVKYVIAPGFTNDPIKYHTTIRFAIIMFPYLGFMSMTAIISGMLNSIQRYFAAAVAPIFLNIILISILLYSYHYRLNYWSIGLYLSIGTLLSGIIQFTVVAIEAKRASINIKLQKPHLTKEIRKMLILAFPAAISGGITQINLLINTSIASTSSGAISSLAYADRLYQLPLGIIGISIGTVLLSEISRTIRSNETTAANILQNRAIEFALFLALPASAALICFGKPIIILLLQHGHFTNKSTDTVTSLLKIYGIGLPSFILIKTLIPIYFARQDTKTPLIFSTIAVIINVTLALSLFPLLKARGIAIAEVSASWINCILLFTVLIKNKNLNIDRISISRIFKFLTSAIAMGVELYFITHLFQEHLSSSATLLDKAITNLIVILSSMLIYFIFIIILKAIDIKTIKNNLSKKVYSNA